MRCPKCGADNMIHYTEENYGIDRRINKDNTISKRISLKSNNSYSMPDYIKCLDCYATFDYDLDDRGRIYNLLEF